MSESDDRIYSAPAEDVERCVRQSGARSLERWDCPCGCGGFACFGLGPSQKDPAQDVIWLMLSCTFYPALPAVVVGIEDVNDIETMADWYRSRPAPNDGVLVQSWLDAGLRVVLVSLFRRS